MDTALSLRRYAAPPVRTPHASIVLIYDSFDTAVRGKAFCDELARKLEVRTDLGQSLWRSQLLAIPEIRQEAARTALAADFVVLSLRGDEALSTVLDRWFGEWMPHARDRDLTLVILFDPATALREPTNRFLSYLRTAAFAAGVHFFAHTAILGGEPASRERPAGAQELSPVRLKVRQPKSRRLNGLSGPSNSAQDGIRIDAAEGASAG